MSEIEIRNDEREKCALLLEELAKERLRMASGAPRERRTFYLETADLIARLAQFVRERESVTL